jgi:hypothetical protein
MIPLQRRILVTLTAVVAAVLFACLALVVVLVRRDELLALDRVIVTEARVLARELERDDRLAQGALETRTLALPEEGTSDAVVAVFDADGHLLTPLRASLAMGGKFARRAVLELPRPAEAA